MSRTRRIAKELEEVKTDVESGISIKMVDDSDISHLKGIFKGPPGTPYEGGEFVVDMEVPLEYPFKPPKMKFDTKIYHPNISSRTGAICLDILKDKWSPVFTLKSTLISLQSLLQSPEPTDPQDAEVANHYLSDKAGFDKTVKYWTQTYAKPGGVADIDPAQLYGIDPEIITNFEGMGFQKDNIIEVLRRFNVKNSSELNESTNNKVLEALLK